MTSLFGAEGIYIDVDKSSVTLTLDNMADGAITIGSIKPTVTGAYKYIPKIDKVEMGDVDYGYDANTAYEFFSSDTGVAQVYPAGTKQILVAKGVGSANVYIRNKETGAMATVAVTVQSNADANSKKELAAKQAAANKAIVAGEKTDVSEFSKFAASVVKNADGEDTVTITKGKNVKNAKINTITIG
ncbi:MAG: hypothetical protein K6B14_02825, partial [Lachnospiraceae bacterium]|nr:hypothetical protein [Lachnospiraceae bacterium]